MQEAGPGAASACLTAWGAPPFSGPPACSPSSSPLGAAADTRCRVGTAPATSRRRWEKRRFFWITEETSKQAGAKWSEQMTERSLPPYQSARRPRTKRSHSSRTARSLGKRNSDFPDLVVLPQWAATQRAGMAATSASARPRAPSRGNAVPLRRSGRRGASSRPLPPATGSAELGPHRGVRGARVSASARSQRSSPESGWPPAEGSKFRAGRAEVGRKEERTGSGCCHSYRGGRPPPRLLPPQSRSVCTRPGK